MSSTVGWVAIDENGVIRINEPGGSNEPATEKSIRDLVGKVVKLTRGGTRPVRGIIETQEDGKGFLFTSL